jgi:hypothetical protein
MSWSTTKTQHEIAVEVDSWSIVHLIMPIIIEDPHEWVKLVSKRTEVPPEALGIVTPRRFAFNRRFCLFLRSNEYLSPSIFVTHFLGTFVKDSFTCDASRLQSQFFRIPHHFMTSGGTPDQFLQAAFVWYTFLRQQHFRPYWDDIEGVGIIAQRNFNPPDDLRQLQGFSVSLPHFVRDTVLPKLIRDSRTRDLYIGGPVSLVNHACSTHSNCVLDLNHRVSLSADTFIESGTRVYICYNSNEDEMLRARGFQCAVCVRYIKEFIQASHYIHKSQFRKRERVAALANLEERRADRSSSLTVAHRMPQLSEMFSVDRNAVEGALGSAVAPGYVLSSLVSTTFGTNDEGEYFHIIVQHRLT